MIKRCAVSMEKLSCTGKYDTKIPEAGSLPVYNFHSKATGPIETMKGLASKFLGK